MSFLSNFTASFPGERPPFIPPYSQFNLHSLPPISSRPTIRISPPFQDTFRVSQIGVGRSSRYSRKRSVCMALINERLGRDRDIAYPSSILAYELVQGKLGLLFGGWHKNFQHGRKWYTSGQLKHMKGELLDPYMWSNHGVGVSFLAVQFVLVDLRCHGDSASIKKRGPHTVASTALDVLKLIAQLRITPRVLIGHSFGGKVVLSMVEQAAKPLPRPVRVWVLDATPGKVRAGQDGEDHPGKLISFLRKLPKEVSSKRDIVNALIQEGFSKDVAQHYNCRYFYIFVPCSMSSLKLAYAIILASFGKGSPELRAVTFNQLSWVVTNLRPTGAASSSSSSFSWVFDLEGISEMYESYEETNLWKVVENLPRGVHVNFLKAERSLHRWALEDLQRIHAAEESAADEGGGVEMHVLEDAGHWVHADNPDGLFRILSFSFKGVKA
ncbi:hypothetical protein GOBAR_DD09535 [Gossypium barbadense]|nr:hypothetical protein GOBAR_DD09535 [Gossypium barbadense]